MLRRATGEGGAGWLAKGPEQAHRAPLRPLWRETEGLLFGSQTERTETSKLGPRNCCCHHPRALVPSHHSLAWSALPLVLCNCVQYLSFLLINSPCFADASKSCP